MNSAICRHCCRTILGLMIFILGTVLQAQEWTRFRGPNGTGVSNATSIPVRWTDKDYNWKVKLPGIGHSSPVLWGNKVFVTSGDASSGKRIVVCINATDGKMLWTQEFTAKSYRMHARNSVATSTPVVDAERVYATFGTPAEYVVIALDHAGKTVWQVDLGPYRSQHGFGPSPVVYLDMLILPNDQDKRGSIVALDAATGKKRWQVKRQPGNATYSTPCVYKNNGRDELIFTNWQHGITAIDPKTGKTSWEISCFEPMEKERAIASPVVAGDLILGTCGFVTAQKHFVAVRPGDSQKGGKPEEVWRIERAVSYLPSPLVKGNRIFLCSELGVASCVDSATGKLLWQERVPGSYSGSPVCVGNHIYCISNDGDVLVLAAADKFEIVARNALGEGSQSTPAVANRRMYLRTRTQLFCIGGPK